ncbi:MAG: bifunctional phosphoribosylaminoimidazolecarboxamide formyltransferase/IMP cyclohydrolase [Frankiaceae bacterium]
MTFEAPTAGTRTIRRALISVSDKTGLAELGTVLADAGVEIVSTGSTAQRLTEAGVKVHPVSEVTGFPECLDGRVKTLHPAIHAGLLADTANPAHVQQLDDLGIAPFDLLVSNLYPFRETVAAPDVTDADCVEQIDIGGPAMVRAAAKNHPTVAVVVDPEGYGDVAEAVRRGGFTLEQRRALAAAAFAHTAAYDAAVASWFARPDAFPPYQAFALERAGTLRYGENPHQPAAIYSDPDAPPGLAQAEQLAGKEMSYNNYVDADAARRAAYDFPEPAVAIIKHANPCGIAVGSDVADAHRKAHACDPLSAFGGVIATNRPVTVELARQISGIFTEVVVAPGYAEGAVDILTAKPSLRLLRCAAPSGAARTELRQISGGMLVQAVDRIDALGDDPAAWKLVASPAADDATLRDLAFGWRAVRATKSNAVLLAADGATVGVGMGQVNRVDAARLAVARAGDRAGGSVAASDAFVPFADGLEVLTDAGIRAVVEPGGSVRDAEVIAAADAAGVTLYFTGTRHFYH